MPFNRLARLQKRTGDSAAGGYPVGTDGSRCERDQDLALNELIRVAAQGGVVHNDDTGMRILKLARNPDDKRTGTFTSGIVSICGG